jgi:hypothetical protein
LISAAVRASSGDRKLIRDLLVGIASRDQAGAISNAYYPESNRGPGLVFSTAAIDIAANMANGVIQEFVLRKLTPSAKKQPQLEMGGN